MPRAADDQPGRRCTQQLLHDDKPKHRKKCGTGEKAQEIPAGEDSCVHGQAETKADFRLLFVLGWVVDYFFFLRLAIFASPRGC